MTRSAHAGGELSRDGCLALLLEGRVVLATTTGIIEELALRRVLGRG